jgi:Alginate export
LLIGLDVFFSAVTITNEEIVMKMGTIFRTSVGGTALAGWILSAIMPPVAGAATTLEEALGDGKATLDVRYRYEHVDQSNDLKNADASTVRSRLGYGSGDFNGMSAYLELENVTAVGAENYNSGVNGKTTYSVVPDPIGSQVDQATLIWNGTTGTLIKLGRQTINLDNQRFVGRVDWRQNGQTFDAISIVNKSLSETVITYAYVSNVDRISTTSAKMNSNLLNASYSGWAAGIVTAYAYLLDYDQTIGLSTQTYGLRFAGGMQAGKGGKVLYTAEIAQQGDYAKNPANYNLNYMLFEVGGVWSGITSKLGYELMGGDGTHSVQTPLATLHAFNGWADQFLSTPANGLQDVYVSVGGSAAGVNLLAVYHDFTADKGGDNYGNEWDLQAMKKINKTYTFIAKYADYSADGAAGKVDTDKLWLVGQLSF